MQHTRFIVDRNDPTAAQKLKEWRINCVGEKPIHDSNNVKVETMQNTNFTVTCCDELEAVGTSIAARDFKYFSHWDVGRAEHNFITKSQVRLLSAISQ